MSAKNMFLSVAGVLIVIAIIVGLTVWKPFASPLLVSSDSSNTATGEPAASDVVVSHTAPAQTVKEGASFVSVIRYNGDTFSPRILVINKGENVRFVNSSNLTMRIEADRTSTSTVPATYQQAQSVGKNGTYELSFVNAGVWIVKNLNDISGDNTAVIYVK